MYSFIRFTRLSNRINVWISFIYRTTFSPPNGMVEMYCPFRGTCCLRHDGIWVTPRRHIPEESDTHNHIHDNLPSHSFIHFLFPPSVQAITFRKGFPIAIMYAYPITFSQLHFRSIENPADITTLVIPSTMRIKNLMVIVTWPVYSIRQ